MPIVAALALAKLALHLGTTGRWGYGFFVDELYFLDCSRHLAWGYVDMPPLFPALTALLRATLGESLLAVRVLPALAGAALVLLAALLARELGAGRAGQALAALAVLTAPIYLVLHSLHTMNELEPLLWTGSALLLARLANGASPRLWLAFGALAGVGLLNKHSIAFFLLAAAAGILATDARRHLATPWPWLGAALAFALFLPNLLWELEHRFPHLEMLANIRKEGRDVSLSPLAFLAQQVLLLNPLAAPLWIAGLAWLLFAKEARVHRALGIGFLVLMAEMLLLDGRVYYPAPYYPILFAAGGVAFERALTRRRWPVPAYAGALALAGALLAPIAFPCVPPETYVRYVKAIGLAPPPIETHRLGPLPQLLADRCGWKEMVDEVARVWGTLTPEERAKAGIFAQNYGQAGALNHYGPAHGLPPPVSAHLTHWYWGPHGVTGEVLVVLDDHRERLEELFEDVRLAGRVSHPYAMPYEQFDVWVCRRMRNGETLATLWPHLKNWS